MKRQEAKSAKNAKDFYKSEPPRELDQLAHAVIGAAIEVHRQLGPGFLEHIYESAMVIELHSRGLRFERQVVMPVLYKGRHIAESRIDLLVGDTLVVELKAVEELRPIHRAQLLSYLRTGAFQLGLLLNFNCYALRDGICRVVSSG
jgi:GxxExxY protein